MQPHALCAAKYGSLPKLQFYCSLHKDFGVKVWLTYTGSKGGKKSKNPWEGIKFWFDEIPESYRDIIIREKHFNRPEAVAAKEKEDPNFFAGPFDPTKFLVRSARLHVTHCRSQCFRELTQPCLLRLQLQSQQQQLAALLSATGALCISLGSSRALVFWHINFNCNPCPSRLHERHHHHVNCTVWPSAPSARRRLAAPLGTALDLRKHWHLMRNHVILDQFV